MSLLENLVHFVNRWLGSASQVGLIFLGILICVAIVISLWDKRITIFGATIGVFSGLVLIFHSSLYAYWGQLNVFRQIGLLTVVAGLAIGTISCWTVYTTVLRVRYAVLWLGLSLGLLFLSYYIYSSDVNGNISKIVLIVTIGYAAFVTLLLLYFSLVLTKLEKRMDVVYDYFQRMETNGLEQSRTDSNSYGKRITFRMQVLFTVAVDTVKGFFSTKKAVSREIRGTRIGAPIVIGLACFAVFSVGFLAPQAMIGDEVTHYYMLVKQSHDLSKPNFFADIPHASGQVETRRYPHSFLWHYGGALIYRLAGNSFLSVQIYQTFFLFQLLFVGYLLARRRGGVETRSALVYVITLASLPLCLFFSVAFYQDVPMAAQAITAFYLLDRRRWLLAACFMALALGMKVTAVLFFPSFFIFFLYRLYNNRGICRAMLPFILSLVIVLGFTYCMGKAINIYAQAPYYPQERLETIYFAAKEKIVTFLLQSASSQKEYQAIPAETTASQYSVMKTAENAPVEIANHPGDLRNSENFLVFGGIIIWLLIAVGLLMKCPLINNILTSRGARKRAALEKSSSLWLFGVGGSFLVLVAYFTRTAPDARFFLPGLPFVLLPFAEWLVKIKKSKAIIGLLVTLAVLQSGYVLSKTYSLRAVSSDFQEAIDYLSEHPFVPPKVFMYPEGNYRLFSVPHEWYLGYRLRELWRAENPQRIRMFDQFGVGAILVKKKLVAEVDQEITNLGVYPTSFVADLETDKQFRKVFDNKEIVIFLPPYVTEKNPAP